MTLVGADMETQMVASWSLRDVTVHGVRDGGFMEPSRHQSAWGHGDTDGGFMEPL